MSTWLKHNFPDAYLIDLLDDKTHRELLVYPERLKQIVGANAQVNCHIIEEVQKAPALLDSVHSLIEDCKTHQFILTGSSTRKLRRGGVNLLAGRAVLTHFHPFMAAESGPAFTLEKALKHGLVPLVVTAAAPEKTLESYISLYLK